MNSFKICHWDDRERVRIALTAACLDLGRKFGKVEYSYQVFYNILKNTKQIVDDYDLLILDLLDQSESKDLIGFQILQKIKDEGLRIPIIVYTTAKRDGGSNIDLNKYEKIYPGVIFVQKSEDADTSRIKSEIEKVIKERLPDQFEVSSGYVSEFNQQLSFFGRNKINQILFQVKQHFSLPVGDKIKLSKLKSGFSGAILFKFTVNNTSYVLKISNEVQLLETELENAKKQYPIFPAKLTNWINNENFYTHCKQTLAIVIKLVLNSKTLFDFITNENETTKIEKVLNSFFHISGMTKHYKDKREEPKIWTTIFEKFKTGKFLTIKEVSKELKSMLKSFDVNQVENLIINEEFGKLNSKSLLINGAITLNHNDLHSKNILVEDDETPLLIDTGELGYDYWCLDVCRLIIDLYINGIGYEKDYGRTREFFDLNSFDYYFSIGQKIVDRVQIEYDTKNDRIIDSINWLSKNVNIIYGTDFTIWEFQLGLMKELLQVSYRTGSIPPNKRALALELAYYSMTKAEKNTIL